MAAYVIATVDVHVHDQALYDEYRQQVPAVVAQYGGRFLVRGGACETLEGSWQPKRVVVLEFDSTEAAKRWYDSEEYRRIADLRQRATSTEMILVQGV
jgi:uncharacterized protein (DUF1330 family)